LRHIKVGTQLAVGVPDDRIQLSTFRSLLMLKVNAGLTRKIGLPAYGSAGASCAIEMELDQALVLQDVSAFQNRLAAIYNICREAVERELITYRTTSRPDVTIENQRPTESQGKPESNPQFDDEDPSNPPTNGAQSVSEDRIETPLATDRQINFAHHLARQIRALGGQRLKELAQQIYSRPLEELTSREASQLIDLLKDMRAGNLDVGELLPGAAA
jgi:hypothetical protein